MAVEAGEQKKCSPWANNGGAKGKVERTATIACAKCGDDFQATYITKVPTVCEGCKDARIRDNNARARAARGVKPRDQSGRARTPGFKLKLIPYAGYDHEEMKFERGQFYADFPFVREARRAKR